MNLYVFRKYFARKFSTAAHALFFQNDFQIIQGHKLICLIARDYLAIGYRDSKIERLLPGTYKIIAPDIYVEPIVLCSNNEGSMGGSACGSALALYS
jgi:hypothetical protein